MIEYKQNPELSEQQYVNNRQLNLPNTKNGCDCTIQSILQQIVIVVFPKFPTMFLFLLNSQYSYTNAAQADPTASHPALNSQPKSISPLTAHLKHSSLYVCESG